MVPLPQANIHGVLLATWSMKAYVQVECLSGDCSAVPPPVPLSSTTAKNGSTVRVVYVK